ncbi:MAG: phosphatase PAP2 family protein [Lachnospiraceae bacterium]|nr:phosphatase PAP2 family protein [Lachnospiraceae bacterium]
MSKNDAGVSTKQKVLIGLGVLFILAFVALIFILKSVDVGPVGPDGNLVGLSGINLSFSEAVGVNLMWYDVTDYLGYFALGLAGCFALAGLVQGIKRNNFLLVDGEIIALGVLYAVTAALYVMFEFVVINCRPVIMPGEIEAEPSFPSSHTMLSVVVMGSAAMLAGRYIKNTAASTVVKLLCLAVLGVIVAGRLLSGVHWLTDIIGALFVSTGMLMIYKGVISGMSPRVLNRRK